MPGPGEKKEDSDEKGGGERMGLAYEVKMAERRLETIRKELEKLKARKSRIEETTYPSINAAQKEQDLALVQKEINETEAEIEKTKEEINRLGGEIGYIP